jgi:hypothetical protein
VVEAWRGIIERVAEKRPELAAFLQHAAPLEIGTERIRLAIEPNSVFVDQVGSAECQDAVLRAAHAELGSAPRLELETDDARLYFAKSSSTVAAADAEARERKRREDLARAYAHPRIREAIEILGARVRQVTLPD